LKKRNHRNNFGPALGPRPRGLGLAGPGTQRDTARSPRRGHTRGGVVARPSRARQWQKLKLVFMGSMVEDRGQRRASPRGWRLTEWGARRGGDAGGGVPSRVVSSGGRRRVSMGSAARIEGGEAEERFA
jgi:hypothetical protein